MSYIVLEGISLYIFLLLIILLVLISFVCIAYATLSEIKNNRLADILQKETKKVKKLFKENFILKLKCGEFNTDDKR